MKDDRLYLIHILECIERTEQYTADGQQTFFNDIKTQDATVRNLQVLAESTKRISEKLKSAHPEIAWRRVKGFCNIVMHDYLGIEYEKVWNIVEKELPGPQGGCNSSSEESGGLFVVATPPLRATR